MKSSAESLLTSRGGRVDVEREIGDDAVGDLYRRDGTNADFALLASIPGREKISFLDGVFDSRAANKEESFDANAAIAIRA